MTSGELIDLEEQGWRALSTSGEAAVEFYGRVLDESPVMLLPGGLRLDNRDEIIKSMSGTPWSTYRLEDVRAFEPAPGIGVVTYGVVAVRSGSPAYSALMSDVYLRRADGWRLVLHQQTPR